MLTVGIDVGGTNLRAGVVDVDGAVLDSVRVPTPGNDAALEEAIALAVEELAGRHRIGAVGLAVAGFVTADRRGVHFAPHLSWRHAPVAERISRRLRLPVTLEHDANAAAVAEHHFGAARGAHHMVLVAIGTGIGAALLVHGEVYRGANGVAPELGHLRLVPDGRGCPCGKRGCWERYCSGTALVTSALQLLAGAPPGSSALAGSAPELTGQAVAAAAAAGDPVAAAAVAELARWLGEGLALVADVYDPELVVIGGGVSGSAALFLDGAREHYAAALTGAGHRPLAQIRAAQLGCDAGIVGAGLLARRRG